MDCQQQRRAFDTARGNTITAALVAAKDRVQAAHVLSIRLKEAGMQAMPKTIPYDQGCAVLVYVAAPRDTVLAWLEHYAINYTALPTGEPGSVFTYAATISGQEILLVIIHREPT